jgi:cation diffusion facilitator family transporter
MKTAIIIQKASLWGVIINLILAVSKITGGLWGNSLALLSDGLDSLIDVFSFILSYFVSKIIQKPPTPQFPFGYKRAETVATKALSFLIFFIGAELFITSLKNMLNPPVVSTFNWKVVVLIASISILVKFFFGGWLIKLSQASGSSILKASGMNMKGDVFISASVIVSSFGHKLFGIAFLDYIFTFIISLWILKTAFSIFKETSFELMDGISDPELYEKIFAKIEQFPSVKNPHRVRIRKIGNHYSLNLDLEIEASTTILDAHNTTKKIETVLKEEFDSLVDIVIHLEPFNNDEPEESYGLSKDSIKKTKE